MSAKPRSRITRKISGLVAMQIFDLHLTKRNTEQTNEKSKKEDEIATYAKN